MRKATAALLGTVLTGTLVTACGSDAGDTTTGDPDGRGPITFATIKDGTGTVPELVEQWNDDHPDEQVTIVELPEGADGQRQKLVQQAQTQSDAYDVITIDLPWNAEFAARRWITELPPDQFRVDGFFDAALAGSQYRDGLYSIPHFTGSAMLYFREDLLEKVSAEPPTTWAELAEVCDEVLALPEAEGMSCYAGQHDKYEGLTVNFLEAVASAGGTVFDEQGRPHLDTPEAAEGLRFLVEGLDEGRIPGDAVTYKEEEGRRAFQQGELVFHRNWAYIYALVNADDGSSEIAGDAGVTVIPGKDGPGVSSLGGNNLAVSSFSTAQATARDFIAWLTGLDTQLQHAEGSAYPMTRTEVYSDPGLREQYPYLTVLKDGIENARPRPSIVRYGDASTVIQNNVYAAITGERSADKALATMQQELTALTQGS
ncbi:ABC transporter substrate-binding protein [Saccharomonospora piscinae]|uniref:ABC transporter substrate-binding protein n=1 Tax=Saccharomonospora piscinae TaxID=687388 RepID=A0A1V9ACC4_SACPI|nr:ABC transporter substrate-binding protein [Saccharomonospora piscinae]OQO94740.1 ABC transporter substrate-binding protein [Saccharomonospora piscinae]